MDPILIFFVVMLVFMYLLLIRPQRQQARRHQELLSNLKVGDEVVTAGGIVGLVNKVEDDFVKIQVANNMELRVQKSAIGATLPKGTLKSLDEA